MEYKSPPLKTIQLKSLVLQLRGGKPGKEQGQLAVKDTDPDYLKILTNYPQQAEYIRNKNRLADNITIKIYSDKHLSSLVATVPPEKITNNLKKPENIVSNIKGELSEGAVLPVVSKTSEPPPKQTAVVSEGGAVAAGAGAVLSEKPAPKPKRSLLDALTFKELVPPLPVKSITATFTNKHTGIDDVYNDIGRYLERLNNWNGSYHRFQPPHIYFRRVWEKLEEDNPEFFKWLDTLTTNNGIVWEAFDDLPESEKDKLWDDLIPKQTALVEEIWEYIKQNLTIKSVYV